MQIKKLRFLGLASRMTLSEVEEPWIIGMYTSQLHLLADITPVLQPILTEEY